MSTRELSTSVGRALLVLVLLVAAHFQLVGVLRTQVNHPMRADAQDYASYAYNLAHFAIYSRDPTWSAQWPRDRAPSPDALRTPGYPLFLAPFLGDPPTPRALLNIELTQALLSVGTVALSYLLLAGLLGRGLALAGALLLAVSPHWVVASTYVLTESWFTFWLMAGLVALDRALRRPPGLAWLAAAGLALGFATIVRPTLQYAPFVLVPALLLIRRGAGGWRAAGVFALAFALFPGAWAVRNQITLGHAADPSVPVLSVLEGSYAGYMYDDDPGTYPFPRYFDPDSEMLEKSAANVAHRIVAEFGRHPARMLRWYLVEKPINLFGWEEIQGGGDVFTFPVERTPYADRADFKLTHEASWIVHWPLVVGSFVGALLIWTRRFAALFDRGVVRTLRVLSVLLGYIVAVHIAATSLPRYSVPFRAVTVLFALALVAALLRWREQRAAVDRPGGVAAP